MRTLALLDRFLAPVCEQAASCGLLLVLTSDHGNIECMGAHNHSLNPVPLAAAGPGADELRASAASITDVTPRLLKLMA